MENGVVVRDGSALSLERLLGVVALSTTGYYLLTFAVEVGFFWTVGLQFMSAFTISDHVSHAAAWVLSFIAVGIFLFAVTFLFMGWIPAHPILYFAEKRGGGADPEISQPISVFASGLIVAVIVAMLGAVFAYTFLETEARPAHAFLPVISLAMASFAISSVTGKIGRLWIAPAILAMMMAPFALGDYLYLSEYNKVILRGEAFKISDKPHTGRPIFLGADKALYRTRAGIYLATNDGDSVIRIVPDVPPHWQLPSKFPCAARARNDPGPRTVFCRSTLPPNP